MIKFPYEKTHIKYHFFLESFNKINSIKTILLALIPTIIFLMNYFNVIDGFSETNYSVMSMVKFNYDKLNTSILILYLICGLFFSVFSSLIVHFFAYVQIKRLYYCKCIRQNKSIKWGYFLIKFIWSLWDFLFKKIYSKNRFKDIVFKIVSPDIVVSEYYKKILMEDVKSISYNNSLQPEYEDIKSNLNTSQWSLVRIFKKHFIEFSNWLNIILTLILFLTTFFITFFTDSTFIQWFLAIIFYRIFSRGIEIIIAFYNDVVKVRAKRFKLITENSDYNIEYINGFSTSLLRQSGRLSLAIHSLIEMMFLFASAYFLYFQVIISLSDTTYILMESRKLIHDEYAPTLTESLLMSATLGVFNISYGIFPNILLGLLHVFQILISGVLILLSIAQYLGADKTLNNEDKYLYTEIATLNDIKDNYPKLSPLQIWEEYDSKKH